MAQVSPPRCQARRNGRVNGRALGTSNAYGEPKDRNVELVLDDPRDNPPTAGGGAGAAAVNPASAFAGHSDGSCVTVKRASRRGGRLVGTAGGDRLVGRGASDSIRGLAGDDCLKGRQGADRLKGGLGADIVKGGPGSDRIGVRDGEVDRVTCGGGHDRVVADRVDLVLGGCESVRRG
jgi:Ca2+-binding RTX toxin-like protein